MHIHVYLYLNISIYLCRRGRGGYYMHAILRHHTVCCMVNPIVYWNGDFLFMFRCLPSTAHIYVHTHVHTHTISFSLSFSPSLSLTHSISLCLFLSLCVCFHVGMYVSPPLSEMYVYHMYHQLAPRSSKRW